MALKFSIKELFVGKFPNPKNIYAQLEDLDKQIREGADPIVPLREDVKLNKTGLKKAFGDPKEFNSIGIVRNTEGSYLIVSDRKQYKFVSLENL